MAKDIVLNEMDTLSIQEVINSLSSSYIKLIKERKRLDLFPSIMLWGQPGVGKSQAIKQIAKNIEKSTYKTVKVTDVRLLLFNPIDLRGIPVANASKTLAVWLKPQIFQMDPSDNVINILFLDEISAAPQSVQSAAYQITLDRTVGEHKLPDNCIVIAAGNRVSDKSVAYKMPKALANRLLHFNISTSFADWKKWALHNNIHPLIIGFLAERPDLLNTFDSSNESLAFATPRSWEMVSNILNNISSDIDEVYSLIAGLVGGGIAFELRTYGTVFLQLPKVDDIFAGKAVSVPRKISEIFALSAMMVKRVNENKNDLVGIANSIKYACRFPTDFGILLLEEYLSIDESYKQKLLRLPEFSRWLNANAGILNGQVHGLFK
jgi:hypothetical protein